MFEINEFDFGVKIAFGGSVAKIVIFKETNKINKTFEGWLGVFEDMDGWTTLLVLKLNFRGLIELVGRDRSHRLYKKDKILGLKFFIEDYFSLSKYIPARNDSFDSRNELDNETEAGRIAHKSPMSSGCILQA